PLDTYVQALTTVQQQYPLYAWGSEPQDEMAALLLLSLSVNRRGATFDAEQTLGAGALSIDPDFGLRRIVDLWGQPLAFFRFSTEYNGQNTPNAITQVDDQDPELTLQNASWQAAVSPLFQQPYLTLFQQHCHALATTAAPLYPATIISAGPNRRLGLLP